jgi:hypothetical protein
MKGDHMDRIQQLLNEWHEAHRAQFVSDGLTNLLASFDQQEKKHAHSGQKYTRLDVGGSGAWMLEIQTGIVYGIKGYGTPDKKKIAGDINDPCFNGSVLFRDRFRRGRFDNRKSFRVHLGGKKYQKFSTLGEAKAFCDKVASDTSVILAIQEMQS